MRRDLIVAALCFLSVPAFAEEPAVEGSEESAPELAEAKSFLKQYLDTIVKAAQGQGRKTKPADVSKKLRASSKLIHPKTLELIAQQEKNKVVTNALATWHWAKNDYWLMEYEITEAKKSVLGTVIIDTMEKNWRVEEGGEDGEPEPASYLLSKQDGKWLLIDKRRNSSFTDDAILVGYKGYFPGKHEAQKPTKVSAETEEE
jgi:hypothetical protein